MNINKLWKGIIDCIVKTYRYSGIYGFTKGLTLNIPRAILWNGVDLSTYEVYKKVFHYFGLS